MDVLNRMEWINFRGGNIRKRDLVFRGRPRECSATSLDVFQRQLFTFLISFTDEAFPCCPSHSLSLLKQANELKCLLIPWHSKPR